MIDKGIVEENEISPVIPGSTVTFSFLVVTLYCEWRLEKDTYFLYRKDRLLEAYSADPGHPVCGFVPVQGGHNDNKLMIRLADSPDPLTVKIAAAVKNRTLLFPIADTF